MRGLLGLLLLPLVTFSNPDNISSPFLLSDPMEEEEQLSNSQVTVVTVEEDVCHVVNPGGDLLTPTILQQAVSLAFQRKSVCESMYLVLPNKKMGILNGKP